MMSQGPVERASRDSNPLLSFDYRFDFSALKPEHIGPAIDALLAQARAELAAIADPKTPRTLEGTLRAFDRAGAGFSFANSMISLIEAVNTSPAFREKYNAVQARISEFHSSIYVDAGLWGAIKAFRDSAEGRALTGSTKRYLDRIVRSFETNGADLPPAQKQELVALNTKLAEVTNRYSQNVLDSTNEFEWVVASEVELSGLPPSALAMGKESAAQKKISGYRFTLQGPSYLAILTYHDDPKVREHFHRAQGTRASSGKFDNSALVEEILALRAARASLLGKKDFADLVTEERMAGSGATVAAFAQRLAAQVMPHAERDLAQLQAFRDELEGAKSQPLQPWDVAYYSEKLQRKLFNLDPEALRPYFQFEKVLDGIFGLANKLFGVTITEEHDIPTWDKTVRVYQVTDHDGKRLGHFFADYFPRESKRGGAWMDGIFTGVKGIAGREQHIGFMGGNFTPPTGDAPSLLTHDEVLTLFHEAGHLLHHMLGKVEFSGASMMAVPWDFVELPSQLMENWAWEKSVLDTFATHYQTGEKIPAEMIESLKRAQRFQAGWFYTRQVALGSVDLALHRDYKPGSGNVVDFGRETYRKFIPLVTNDSALVNSFTHLFSSPVAYAAGYYSYLWAEVLEADAFSVFQKEGLVSRTAGERYRKAILERGDSEDAMQMVVDFLGRKPDEAAMLRRAGLS